ncbi:MAG: alanine racemase [Pseudomonadales bacterium]|nr:alanine racemase [Pseudomonadales bacterium]
MIGDPVEMLETPVLVVDLDALEHNVGVIAGHYRGKSIRVRPHGKNHKSLGILRMQLAAGSTVSGVCAAKVSEAEVLAASGVDNVLVANQVVVPDKIARLARLAERVDTMVAVDALAQVDLLAMGAGNATLGVVIEIDTMMGRGGVRTVESAVALARRITATPGLEFRGVMSHQVPVLQAAEPPPAFRRGRAQHRPRCRGQARHRGRRHPGGTGVDRRVLDLRRRREPSRGHRDRGGHLRADGGALRLHERIPFRRQGHGTRGREARRPHRRGRCPHRRHRRAQRPAHRGRRSRRGRHGTGSPRGDPDRRARHAACARRRLLVVDPPAGHHREPLGPPCRRPKRFGRNRVRGIGQRLRALTPLG